MSNAALIPRQTTLEVRDRCLCLQAQRAARALARRFDRAFAPLGLTNQQFSLLMSLNRPEPPSIGAVAETLVVDRTTLTAALKPLARRGLVEIGADPHDRRTRRLTLTFEGHALLRRALPIWRETHDEIDRRLLPTEPSGLREALERIGRGA